MIHSMGAPIQKTNLYEIVAQRIEELIISTPEMHGHQLPSEQEIADSYGISRNVVREALKILKERGLVVLRNGEGAFVEINQNDIIVRTIERMMQFQELSYEDIYSVREPLEILSSRLAARHITEEQLNTLRELLKQMEINVSHEKKWAEYDLQFHLTIAQASGNLLLYNILKSLTPSFITLFTRASSVIYNCCIGLADHEALILALASGDEERAADTMKEHLQHSLSNQNDLKKRIIR